MSDLGGLYKALYEDALKRGIPERTDEEYLSDLRQAAELEAYWLKTSPAHRARRITERRAKK